MRYTEEEKEFFERRSTENLVGTYRQELLRIDRGEDCFKLMSRSIRRRLREYGILKKLGNKYLVTPKGREMLAVVGDAEG